jgi:hypothetical protein
LVVAPGSLPAARVAGWLGTVLWPSGYLFLTLVLLLFPNGRLLSPRWRPVAVVLAVAWSGVILDSAFAPVTTPVQDLAFTNPVAIQALARSSWRAVAHGAVAIAVLGLGAATLAPLLRFRHADPVQRQQLKWFVFIIGVCVVSVLVAIAVEGLLPVVATVLWDVALAGVVAGLPAALGVAILRYRLYDIDRVISRALVYAILTVILGLGYGSLVLALGQLFGTSELLAVVDQTMEPTRVSVWLRASSLLKRQHTTERDYRACRLLSHTSGRYPHSGAGILASVRGSCVLPVASGPFDGLAHEPGAMACSRRVSWFLDAPAALEASPLRHGPGSGRPAAVPSQRS